MYNKTYFNNKQYLTSEETLPIGGVALRFTFPNGYEGSVVKHPYSYGGNEGLWEIAVMQNDEIVLHTPITDDVLGWQTDEDVESVLERIRELPPRVA